MTNQNSNHSKEGSVESKRPQLKSIVTIPKGKNMVSSLNKPDVRVVLPNPEGPQSDAQIQFNEGDDQITMEIDDGGQAPHEFATDDDDETNSNQNYQTSDSEGESDGDETVESPRKDQTDDSESGRVDDIDLQQSDLDVRKDMSENPKCRRLSVEEKLDNLSDTLQVMKTFMMQKGFCEDEQPTANNSRGVRNKIGTPNKSEGKKEQKEVAPITNESETTIYHNILQMNNEGIPDQVSFLADPDDPEIQFKNKNRDSSSSEEPIDTSDEIVEDNNVTDRFIADCAAEAERRRSGSQGGKVNRAVEMVHEAEVSKAVMFATQGNDKFSQLPINATSYDENYQIVGANLDPSIRNKIINHEYVDFSQLIPKDRVYSQDDHRMELICKGGQTYFVPVSDRKTVGIHSLPRWEQAFRVFSNVYTKQFPHGALELIQYNQVICTAAQSYVWENVYNYDKEFRLHLANFPQHNWGVILQQAWMLCLKVRICLDTGGRGGKTKKEACKRFNRGQCTAGLSCKYKHRCTVPECGKFGHGAHICRKRNNQSNPSNASAGPVAANSTTAKQ